MHLRLLRRLPGLVMTLTAMLTLATTAAAAPAAAAQLNPLLQPWTGPYGGVPPFDRVRVADFKPALAAAMAEELADIDRIAANRAKPTFDNTIAAMERSGRAFDRVARIFGVYTSTLNDKDVRAVETEIAPLLAAHADQITQNAKLFARIAAVYAARDTSGLSAEQRRLTWVVYTDFVRAGAKLDAKAKARLSQLNQQLATLYTRFSQNLLADENDHWLALDTDADFAGLPDSVRAAVAAAAEARGIKAKGAVLNTRSSVEPFLEYSSRRDLREKVWRTFVSRGDNGDAHDNNATITEILKLRAERAKLLGYPTHAHWRLEDSMARTPERAVALMEAVWPAAVARVHEEVADMQAVADRESAALGQPQIRIEPWDYRYYAEKVRKEKYDLDANEVKPYLQLEKLREGMFWVAGQLFGLHFEPVPPGTVPVAHPDIRVFEVTNRNGEHVGLWYFDPYARADKASGAWMNAYRGAGTLRQADHDDRVEQRELREGPRRRADPDQLGRRDDAVPRVRPRAARLVVERQLPDAVGHQRRARLRRVPVAAARALAGDAGGAEPVRAALPDRPADSARAGCQDPAQQDLQPGLQDGRVPGRGARRHEAASGGRQPIDPRAFERETLAALGMPHEIVMRHRTPQFGHVFSGDGYSAGYYSYLWSDTLAEDAWEAFTEAKGPYDPAVAAAPARQRVLDRQHARPRRGLPRVPWPRPGHRGAAAQPRLPRTADRAVAAAAGPAEASCGSA